MQNSVDSPQAPGAPTWLPIASIAGILWNAFGVYQFGNSLTSAGRAAMTTRMTSAQAMAYMSLPAWVSVVFAIGAVGGLLGAIALTLRRRIAFPALVISFIGYGLLFIGDALHGVFDGAPYQLVILAFVVLIAAAMLWISWPAGKPDLLQ